MKDLTGHRYGRLVVLRRDSSYPKGKIFWVCQCECGVEKSIRADQLTRGKAISCGCYRNELSSAFLTRMHKTHDLSKTRFYSIWRGMRARCNNPKNTGFKDYGARGIRVCKEWDESFENFHRDMYQSYLEHAKIYGEMQTTLDRIEVNGQYEAANCRWSTPKIQNNNTRHNRFVEYNGLRLTIAQAAERFKINRYTLTSRLDSGWPLEKALNIPEE